jgi:integrase
VAARKQAKDLRREIDEGIDPLNQRENAREAPRVSDITKRYLEEHTPHLTARNAADQHSIMGKLVEPDWGSRLVTEITKANVEKLLTKIAAGRARPSKAKPNNRAHKLQGVKPTPVRANWVGEVLRKMFTLAIGWGWREDNPASSFRRRIENPRERFLCHEEIHKLAEALDAAEDRRAADIIRMCMLTGARVGEVRQAQFEHFNLEHLSWSKPASMTK